MFHNIVIKWIWKLRQQGCESFVLSRSVSSASFTRNVFDSVIIQRDDCQRLALPEWNFTTRGEYKLERVTGIPLDTAG
jgi:hypothetical protein